MRRNREVPTVNTEPPTVKWTAYEGPDGSIVVRPPWEKVPADEKPFKPFLPSGRSD